MAAGKFEFGKTDKEKQVIAAAIAVAAVALYFNFLARPVIAQLLTIVPKVSALKKNIASARSLMGQKAAIEKMREGLSGDIQAFDKMFPREQEVPKLLENFSNIANDSGVRIAGIKPIPARAGGELVGGEIYQAIPIEIIARSGYHELGRFIEKLERGDRFIMIENIDVSANPESVQSHNVRLVAITYVLVKE